MRWSDLGRPTRGTPEQIAALAAHSSFGWVLPSFDLWEETLHELYGRFRRISVAKVMFVHVSAFHLSTSRLEGEKKTSGEGTALLVSRVRVIVANPWLARVHISLNFPIRPSSVCLNLIYFLANRFVQCKFKDAKTLDPRFISPSLLIGGFLGYSGESSLLLLAGPPPPYL